MMKSHDEVTCCCRFWKTRALRSFTRSVRNLLFCCKILRRILMTMQISPNLPAAASDSSFQVLVFNNTKKIHPACVQCRKGHRKCDLGATESSPDGAKKCKRCNKLNIPCSLDPLFNEQTSAPNGEPSTTIFSSENIYAKLLEQKLINSQFVTSTQPLAPIFSKDSMLCFDGEVLGLYSPWRDVNNSFVQDDASNSVDKDLIEFLSKKGALDLPSKKEQKRLIGLYFEHVYPLMPIIDREVDIGQLPPLLINCMMLAGVRYDKTLERDKDQHRIKANQFMKRAKYLEMMEYDRVTLLQAYLLMSVQEEGIQGRVFAREYIYKAYMIVVQLGIHNLGESGDIENFESSEDPKSYTKSVSKRLYDRRLLSRLFWTTFCCDRYICVTTGSAMAINPKDLIMNELSINDFDKGEHQREDYEVFKRWHSLCSLLDRILCNAYRPPGQRVVDERLELDLLNWDDENLKETEHFDKKYLNFFKIAHCYSNLLYLRCQIGVLDLIEVEPESITVHPSNKSPLSSAGMNFSIQFCARVLDILSNNEETVHHIINVHVLLHAMVLIHLEIEVKSQTRAADGELTDEVRRILRFKIGQLQQGLEILKRQRSWWWLAGASYFIFESLLNKHTDL